ncbi:MAG: hypothetical protein COT85_04460 [Chlamydiae bacterium CG10_big_fil_rev_8_21_14_0_10_42_34]|nr:MAG: hypothetical protein COT85_04460 [Chlamydiae bacterium CG10_big_fil_rev_8_21_14_0_10_42_34]
MVSKITDYFSPIEKPIPLHPPESRKITSYTPSEDQEENELSTRFFNRPSSPNNRHSYDSSEGSLSGAEKMFASLIIRSPESPESPEPDASLKRKRKDNDANPQQPKAFKATVIEPDFALGKRKSIHGDESKEAPEADPDKKIKLFAPIILSPLQNPTPLCRSVTPHSRNSDNPPTPNPPFFRLTPIDE